MASLASSAFMNASMSSAFAFDTARVERNIVAIAFLLEIMSESDDAVPAERMVVVLVNDCELGAKAFTADGRRIRKYDSFMVANEDWLDIYVVCVISITS